MDLPEPRLTRGAEVREKWVKIHGSASGRARDRGSGKNESDEIARAGEELVPGRCLLSRREAGSERGEGNLWGDWRAREEEEGGGGDFLLFVVASSPCWGWTPIPPRRGEARRLGGAYDAWDPHPPSFVFLLQPMGRGFLLKQRVAESAIGLCFAKKKQLDHATKKCIWILDTSTDAHAPT